MFGIFFGNDKKAKVGRARSLHSTFAFVISEGNPKLSA